MTDPPTCPACGAARAQGNPSGMCPACLLRAAMGGDSSQNPTPGEADTARWPPTLSEQPGTRIGHYKLLEQIGEGGFGVVWMAEQEEPVRRRLALKIIKLGMDTREVVARFEAERQALAMMEHPNIASVFDGGATATGRPYFVMELVKGVPITAYCDANHLTTHQRLALFMEVCHAVQHAHHKGVIHRDLKPSNILVTVKDDRPVPKVIDFGIVKATQAALTEKTLFTRLNQWIGTPAYMSPEQAGLGSLDVDTRSDIYSLGVLLYELLTGRPPFDPEKLLAAGYDAVMKVIREEEPPKPSTRLSTLTEEELRSVAAKRGAEPAKLRRLMRGDLDWIVMRALEKDRRRRYETANSLARDLEQHLSHEPVVARPPSKLYWCQKMFRRNKLVFCAAGTVAAVIIVGFAVSTWSLLEANRQRIALKDALKRVDIERKIAYKSNFEARLQQAAALRWSGKQERGCEALDALKEAAAVPSALDLPNNLTRLRDSAIACLAIVDMRPVDSWQGNPDYGTMVVPNGALTRYAITFPDGRIAIHRYPDRSRWLELPGNDQTLIPLLQFSPDPDGNRLAATYGTNQEWALKLWDLAGGATFRAAGRGINQAFDFFPDGMSCVVGRPDGSLAIIEVESGATLRQFPLTGTPNAVRVSRDGRLLAVSLPGTGEQADQVAILDAATGEPWATPLACPARALAWSPADDSLAVACTDKVLRVWHGQDWAEGALELRGHTAVADALVWSPDGRLLASQSPDGTIRLWDPFLGTALSWHSGRGSGLAFAADGTRLGILREGATLTVMEVEPGAVCYRGHGYSGETGIFDGVWNRQTTLMATSGDDGVRLWNREGIHLGTLTVHGARGIAFSADALFVASAAGLSRYPMVSAETADGIVITFQAPERVGSLRACMQLSLSADDRLLAVAGRSADQQDDAAAIWLVGLTPGTPPRRLGGPPGVAYCAISPNGEWLAAGTWQGDWVRIWSLTDAMAPVDLPIHGSARVAFSPDDKRLVTGDTEAYRFWKTGTWEPDGVIPSEMGESHGMMAFSPRMTALAIACRRAELRVLDPLTLKELTRPDFDRESPLCFDPTGRLLITTGQSGGIFFWKLDEVRARLDRMGLDWQHMQKYPKESPLPVVRRVVVPDPAANL